MHAEREGHQLQMRRSAAVGLVAALVLASVAASSSSAPAGATLALAPASVSVAKYSTFTVKVVQDVPVATSGAQVSIDFDPTLLQLASVTPGAAYSSAPVFLPADLAADIKAANASGHLAQIAAAFTPPNAVPAGPADFLVVAFRAVGCGQTDVSLPKSGPFNAQLISGEGDLYGHEVQVATTSSAHVTTCVGPDAVSTSVSTTNGSLVGSADGGLPVGLIGVSGLLAVGLISALAWRLRRREQPLDDSVE